MSYPSLALIGKAGAGKDTVAEHLVARHGYTRVAFADPLKAMALRVNPIIESEPYECDGRLYTEGCRLRTMVGGLGWEYAKRHYPEVRRFLQELGAAVRDLEPSFWRDIAMGAISRVRGPVVVTDCRYWNEAEELSHARFEFVRVLRDAAGLTGAAGAHSSETALDGVVTDHTLTNDSTREALWDAVDRMIGAA